MSQYGSILFNFFSPQQISFLGLNQLVEVFGDTKQLKETDQIANKFRIVHFYSPNYNFFFCSNGSFFGTSLVATCFILKAQKV